MEDTQWHACIFPIVLTYNGKTHKHSTIGLTLAEARKEDHAKDVTLNLELNAKQHRKYPDLQVGDRVKIRLKNNNLNNNISRHIQIQTMQ